MGLLGWPAVSTKNTCLGSGDVWASLKLRSFILLTALQGEKTLLSALSAQENSGIERPPTSFVHPRQATYAGGLPSSFTRGMLHWL